MNFIKISYFNELLNKTIEKILPLSQMQNFKLKHKYVDVIGFVKPFNEQ